MINATQISEMTRDEKLRVMEALWANLSEDDANLESPEWHQNALKETEARLESGAVQVLNWADAKRNDGGYGGPGAGSGAGGCSA